MTRRFVEGACALHILRLKHTLVAVEDLYDHRKQERKRNRWSWAQVHHPPPLPTAEESPRQPDYVKVRHSTCVCRAMISEVIQDPSVKVQTARRVLLYVTKSIAILTIPGGPMPGEHNVVETATRTIIEL